MLNILFRRFHMRSFRLALAAFVLAALAFDGPAQAHIKLVSSSPAANATTAKPAKIVLNFNEKLIAKFASATLIMTGMPGMANHAPMKMTGFTSAMSKDGKSMTLLMKRALVAGTYTLKWAAAGADAHPMEGSFTFTVK
jgi:methionine-rich copper-binding protein CopC